MALRMGLLGKKVGSTQMYDAKGEWVPLCILQTGPCVVLNVKTREHDGYSAIQLGFDDKSERLTSKPAAGLFNKVKCSPKRFIREIRLMPEDATQFQGGQTLSVDQVFRPGEIIDVTGTSKGKGFQGVMKRHHFSGFRATHGTHEYFRHGGSIGCRLTPGHVHKGKRMCGQMGNVRTTVQNLRVVEVDGMKNLLVLRGAVPGSPDGYLMIKQAAKRSYRPFQLKVVQPAEPATVEVSATEASPAEQA
jgi:large subunit ribosomal protein L3